MAIANKNIVITPNTSVGSPIPSDPNIVFSASDGGSPDPGALDITLFARPVSSGTLSFEGTAGQLFSITNDLTGTIFSVNDISGIPSIEVEADGTVRLAEFDGNVGIGTGSPAQKLSVVGTVRIIDTGKTDYVDFSHDGTDFNTTFVGSPLPDWNISNQKTLVVSSSVTTSADNLLELNSRFYFRGDGVFNWGNAADYGVLTWNTGRAIIGSNNGYDLELDPSSGIVRLDGAASLRIMDTGETDYVNFSHDGTDFNIAGTNTADINATSGITAWNFPVITLTTALDETYGGTGQITFTTGDILYASGANTLAKLAVGSNTEVLTLAGGIPSWAAPATTGTVTSVSVVSANGLAGTVATATTTPAITLSTTINAPVLAGNGTAISAATTTGTGSTAVLSAAPTLTGTTIAGSINLSGSLLFSTNYSGIEIEDSRNINESPTDLNDGGLGKEIRWDFKTLSNMGSPGTNAIPQKAGTYGGVQTMRPWTDDSGGLSFQSAWYQDTAGGTEPRIAVRGGSLAASWGTWYTIPFADRAETISGVWDFTGATTALTAAVTTNTTQIATTAFVNTEIANDAPNVTLAGTPDYITISGQVITRNLIVLTTDVSGVLPEANGGTNQSTYTTGDILYASGANVLAKLAVGSNTEVLTLAGGVPTWAASASGTNAFGIVTGDSGTITSDKVGDTVQITGGTSITTSVTGSPAVLVITNDAPNVDQNLWLNIASDVGGPVAANTTTDTLTIAGGKNVRTNIAGDTVTVNMTGSPFEAAGDPDQNLWLTVAGDSGSTAANITTDTLTIAGGTGITTAMSGDTLTVTQDTITLGTNTAGDFVGTITGGVGIDSTGATTGEDTDHTLSVDLGEVTAVVFDPAVDFMPIIDGGITGTTQKDAWTDIATAIAGTGITATSGVLAADNVGTITGSGGNNQLAVFSSASNIDSSAVLTTNDTQLTITSAAPFVKFDETGTVGSPIWWWGADGGNMSLRLNNAGPYAYTVSTSAGNNTITAQSWNGADNWVASFASGAQLRIIDTGETDYINIQHDGTDVNFTHNNTTDWNITGLSAINVTATSGGEMLLLTDSGGAGGTANPFIGFDDSANVRQGYVGFGSVSNQDMYLVADIGDIRFVAGGGQVIFETDAYIPDNISLQLGTSADVDMQFNATNLVMTGAGQWQITGFTGGIQAGTIDADFDAITGTTFNGVALTTGGAATNFLDETGSYTALTSNATHTGQVTGATALVLDVTAVTAQPASGAIIAADTIIINDGGVLSEATFTQMDTYFNSSLSFGSGTVTASDGANNRLAVFSTATNVEGDPALLWGSPATLTVSGDLKLTANNNAAFFATFRMGANTLEIFGSPGNMLWIQTYGVDFITRKGGRFVAYETANSNFVELYHDGTDGVVAADGTSGLSFEADYHAFNGEIRAAVSTTSQSSLNIPTGTAPSAPAQGDIWVTASDILARINGVSESLLSGGGGGSPTSASTFTVVDESTDTTTFPVFVNSATGANQPKTGSNLTFNSSTGDLSATLIAGIANANLLDKSTTETVSGSWDISGTWTFLANHFGFNDTVGTRYGTGDDVTILWDGVDLEITGAAANQTINFRDGHHLTLWDSGDTDNVDFHHDGTNFNIAGTNTTDINIQPLSGEDGIVVQANGGVQLYYNNILTAHTSVETLSISANDSSPTTSSGQLTFRLADGTTRSYLGYSGSDTFAMNSSSNSAHVHIGGNDAAGSLRTFLLGDPDATTELRADTNLSLTVTAGTDTALLATSNGSVALYYNNSAKLATTTTGVNITNSLFLNEIANAAADVAADGQIWVRSDVPNNLFFTTDNGIDYPVGYATYRRLTETTLDNIDVTETIGQQHMNGVMVKSTTTARTLTLEASTGFNFKVGSQLSIYNRGATGNITVTDTASQTLWHLTGSAAADSVGGVVIAPGGYATLIRESASISVIMGAGIT